MGIKFSTVMLLQEFLSRKKLSRKKTWIFGLKSWSCDRRYAGRRTDFWDKKSSDFSGQIFRERNYCPRTSFSGSNSCSILSHPVMSWYGSRDVVCPLGRENTAETCSLLGNEGTPPDFKRFFLEKRPWKRFSTNVLIRGKCIHSTVN